MKIAMIGSGYVGLVSGACLAKMGNDVICVDIDENKIKALNNAQIPIYEPGLSEIIQQCFKNGTLKFSTNLKNALDLSDICFIAVGTPMGANGEADLGYVLEVAKSIGQLMTKRLIVVDKSTVPVGTADKVSQIIADKLAKRGLDLEFDVVSNPEFLKEGAAIEDFLKPDRVVIGASSEYAFGIMAELYAPFMKSHDRLIKMDVRSAEMTKYAANSMLATKISFINEMANICELVGADINAVRKGIGSDSRIGYSFIYPGCGYGGSCFPKDVEALIFSAQNHGFDPLILKAVQKRNERQKMVLVEKILNYFGLNFNLDEGLNDEKLTPNLLKGRKIAIWGLTFKPNTDDMRQASSLTCVRKLSQCGASLNVYDPKGFKEAKIYFKDLDLNYALSKYDTLDGCDCLVLLTEWSEFRSPDFMEIKKRLKNPVIFDGRNQYNAKTLKELGFKYYQIGVRA